jgi:hypothetical protein
MSVFGLDGEGEEEEMREEELDPYVKWRIRSSKSVSLCGESTVGKLDMLRDNRRREENTLGGLSYCSNLYCKKTEEKNVIELFKLVNLDGGLNGELNRKLNGEFCDTKPLKPLSNSRNIIL